ncbi:DNA topoisomerase IB [Maribius pontilimi]|uniref:DNA topoisomerase n=1 Tax=Palleronia pontilimi TaxID=1964209 RepID=A0A934IBJ7_9RHOB|nr:DNA topoisomerase IB [Palleronia pontilimi]MBJ3764079.1 DNA topoisomerase IB [Palleronia pontilimi]
MLAAPNLVYYPDTHPGITRKRAGRGWSYTAPDGTRIDDRAERKRLDAMAVPPAYQHVWMSPRPDGHLQATGRDERDRKQYRYHEDWTAFRARQKYDDLAAFGDALPSIRRRISRDLRGEAGDRALATAAVLAMIDRLSLRVGNRDYAEENGTYGATTLRPRHVALSPDALELNYKGKGGKKITRKLRDKRLAQVLHQLDDLPGATLVTWMDDDGAAHEVSSSQVNDLLAEVTGDDAFTAKTFRTWNGTVAAMDVALSDEDLTIKAMAEAAAKTLGNTATIARNSYIHPDVIALKDAPLSERAQFADRAPERRGLRIPERAVLELLKR